MPTLLHIDSSPMPTSVSRELSQELSISWKAVHPDGTVIYRDLAATVPVPVDSSWVYSVYTPLEQRSEAQHASLALSDTLINELERADEIVIGVAMHNFSIPSVLKLWIDQVARVGRTFQYDANGPRGLLVGKRATILVASGGEYAPGSPMAAYDFIEPYLRCILGFMGLIDVTFVKVGGTAQLNSGAIPREELLKPARERVHNIAA